MHKIFCLIICASIIAIIASACNTQTTNSMVKSKRRFEKYVVPQGNIDGKTVDLSEGPKLRYQANFGPQAPSFDFKIVDPY